MYQLLLLLFSRPAVIFYTGGSNLMSATLYNDFLNKFKGISIYKLPFTLDSKLTENVILDLDKKHESLTMVGHSSGCIRLLNNCNNKIKNVILLDPVKTPNLKEKNLNYLNNVIIIEAMKSYEWSYIPPFVPFIPFLKLEAKDIEIEENKVINLKFKDFGHSDLINNPWRDIMHNSRISRGNPNRDEVTIQDYHKKMALIITNYATYYQEN